jgi:hypothetical protein
MDVTIPIRRVPRYVVRSFFGCLLLLGGLLFADYGTSWDEPIDRLNGLVSLSPGWAERQPALQHVPALGGHPDNDHGVAFELPLALFDVLRPGHDMRTYYLVRHAAVFLISLVGVWALFRLATWRFRDERLGLAAAGLLVLSPRFFGESFYNGKDLVFVAFFTLGIYTLVRLLERPTWRRAVVHGLVTAAATDVRVLGLLLLPFTYTLLAMQAASPAEARARRPLAGAALVYLLALIAGMLAAWPYLWEHPHRHLAEVFVSMSHFKWPGVVLYMGYKIPAAALPWHYAPVWMSITTPVAYQLAGLLGLVLTAGVLLREPGAVLRSASRRFDFLVVGWLVAPVAMVIVLHSVLYDGWRHLYFVYPALLLLAVRGGLALAQLGRRSLGWHRLVLGLGVLAGAELLLTAGRMAFMHPFEQTYFSYLPRRVVERSFERDYWGLAYRRGLEYLVARQPQGTIFIDATHLPPLGNNKPWLAPADQARLVLAPGRAGRYFISGYRSTGQPYPDSVGQEVYAVRADGITLLSIFQRPWAGSAAPPPKVTPAW